MLMAHLFGSLCGAKPTWLDAASHTIKIPDDSTNSTFAIMAPGEFPFSRISRVDRK